MDRGPSTKCGNRFPPRSLCGPSRLAACTSQGDLVQSGVLHFARRKGARDEEEIRRATRTGGGGRVVPLPSSPKEGNAPCVPRVVLFLCHLREGGREPRAPSCTFSSCFCAFLCRCRLQQFAQYVRSHAHRACPSLSRSYHQKHVGMKGYELS